MVVPAWYSTIPMVVVLLVASASPAGASRTEPRIVRALPRAPMALVAVHPASNSPRPGLLPVYLAGQVRLASASARGHRLQPQAVEDACRRSPNRGSGTASLPERGDRSAEYGIGRRSTLRVVLSSVGGQKSGAGQDGITRGPCGAIDVILTAGSLQMTANRVRIRGMGEVWLLTASIGGAALDVACAPPHEQMDCAAVVLELVHFLGL